MGLPEPVPGPGLRAARRLVGEGENGRRSVSQLGLRFERSLGECDAARGSGLGCRVSGRAARRSRATMCIRGDTASASRAPSAGASGSSAGALSRSASRSPSVRRGGELAAGPAVFRRARCWIRRPRRASHPRRRPPSWSAEVLAGTDGGRRVLLAGEAPRPPFQEPSWRRRSRPPPLPWGARPRPASVFARRWCCRKSLAAFARSASVVSSASRGGISS